MGDGATTSAREPLIPIPAVVDHARTHEIAGHRASGEDAREWGFLSLHGLEACTDAAHDLVHTVSLRAHDGHGVETRVMHNRGVWVALHGGWAGQEGALQVSLRAFSLVLLFPGCEPGVDRRTLQHDDQGNDGAGCHGDGRTGRNPPPAAGGLLCLRRGRCLPGQTAAPLAAPPHCCSA